MYYVYEWYIVETGEIIYVGKGTRRRYKVRKHNKLFNEMIKRFECDSRIIKEFETEKEAFEYEFIRVNELRKDGQCVCNIHKGGFGGTTEWWTDELRQQYSEKNVMKSELQRKRMSDKNPMKNKAIAEKSNSQKRIPVVIGDKEFESIHDAIVELGTSWEAITNWCKKGINPNGEKCRYKDSEQVEFTGKRYNKGTCKGITYLGEHYETPIDLAEKLGCNVSKLYHWLANGFDHYGNPIRYDTDNRELSFVRRKGANHPVIVNGKKYPSISAASRDLNVSSQWLGDILKGKHTSPNYICKYDDQQPSRGNTDNSTPEGSTTNR